MLTWVLKYIFLVLKHKWFVFVAGLKLGVPLWQLLVHDLSKFSPSELFAYARQSFAPSHLKNQDEFDKAWLHHQNVNPHHWEYWIPRSTHVLSKSMVANEPLPMPRKYVFEMVADWFGASKVYTGSWNIHKWIVQNVPKMRLHPDTAETAWEAICEFNFGKRVHSLEEMHEIRLAFREHIVKEEDDDVKSE